ncbi:hypothetical protein JW824_11555 [bacterium]|nr:hypothetical protein [bacterium]
MEWLIALTTGTMAGTHTSIWGMYKDSPYEGFTYRQYFRSIIIGEIWALLIWWIAQVDVTRASGWFLLFGSTYAMERLTLEYYKTFLREQDQSKYTIPMQFAVFGNVVKSRKVRLLVGLGYLLGIILVGYGLYVLQQSDLGWPKLLTVFLIGSTGGWVSAFGGSWKDAPIEGFQILKFFRSPAVAFFYALLASMFTTNYFLIALCGIGYTVASIETYKTFFFPSKPPGKFTKTPIHFPEMLKRRQRFVILYVAIWLAILVTFVIALMQPHDGLI